MAERPLGVRVGVVGAGETAGVLVREMLRDPSAGLRPVAIFDDDPRRQGLWLRSIPVVGPISRIPAVATEMRIQQLVLAIPSADGALVKRVADAADQAGLALKVLPRLPEILNGAPSVRDVRELQIEDLLGRQEVDINTEQVTDLIEGSVVLITGAGGSIGSEIARQVADLAPGRLVLLDHDETHLHDAATALPASAILELADIRDADRVDELMRRHRPDVVFHAAAHKHVPILEQHPVEAVTTNVMGTANVVAAASRYNVPRFVFISTDKAVRPTSVMGATKWLGEQLVLASAPPNGQWCAVRFGNVFGSRGSVIPTFSRQIAAGGPVTVTDARMTRFFMTVGEAVRLVLQAGALAEGREVFMLEMGEPVNILELAERMIRLTGREVGTDVPIRVVGRRPGEKLFEELRTPEETPNPTAHPAIVRLYPSLLGTERIAALMPTLEEICRARVDTDLRICLFGLAGSEPEVEPVIDLRLHEQTNLPSSSA